MYIMIYNDSKHGFSLNWPDVWERDPMSLMSIILRTRVKVRAPYDGAIVDVSVRRLKKGLEDPQERKSYLYDFAEYLKKPHMGIDARPDMLGIRSHDYILGGEKNTICMKVDANEADFVYISAARGKKEYIIMTEDFTRGAYKDVLDAIVGSFRFVPQ
jgi:hypothetical protein